MKGPRRRHHHLQRRGLQLPGAAAGARGARARVRVDVRHGGGPPRVDRVGRGVAAPAERPFCVRHLGADAAPHWCSSRDRFGVKPLYYHDGGSFVAFASEVKALLRATRSPASPVSPGAERVLHVPEHLHRPDAVRRHQAAAGRARADAVAASRRRPRARCRSAICCRRADPLDIDADEAAAEVHRLFVAAVERQLVSDVPVGHLSERRAGLRLDHDHRALEHRRA